MSQTNSLTVAVYNADVMVFEGPAASVSSTNNMGRFDVIPFHSNFITIISDNLVIYDTAGKKKEIKIDKGVLKVTGNKVDVLLGIIV